MRSGRGPSATKAAHFAACTDGLKAVPFKASRERWASEDCPLSMQATNMGLAAEKVGKADSPRAEAREE